MTIPSESLIRLAAKNDDAANALDMPGKPHFPEYAQDKFKDMAQTLRDAVSAAEADSVAGTGHYVREVTERDALRMGIWLACICGVILGLALAGAIGGR